MRIVLTGGFGYFGAALLERILQTNSPHDWLIVDDLSGHGFIPKIINLGDEQLSKNRFMKVDLLSEDSNQIVSGSDVVIHLAGVTHTTDQRLLEQKNKLLTKKIAAACLEQRAHLIFASSTSVYSRESGMAKETDRDEFLNPSGPYAISKLESENEIRAACSEGLSATILRFGTIFGPSPVPQFKTAVNKFCYQATQSKKLSVWQTALAQRRPYLTIEDAVSSLLFLIESLNSKLEIFNIVSENTTVSRVVEVLKKYVSGLEVEAVEHEEMNCFSYGASSEKINGYGFTSRGNLDKSISCLVEECKRQPSTVLL